MSDEHEYPARLVIGMHDIKLTLITHNGAPVLLVYGAGARTVAAIAQLFEERTGRAPHSHEEPYYNGYQAIGGHVPQEGARWQLADERARQMMIMAPDPNADGVPAQWVRMIGYHGAPAFFPEILPIEALDGARPWD